MKFKIGDKVKFLNDIGGGVVTKIISPTMVEVATEDDFTLPMLVSELLFAQSQNLKESVFNQDFQVNADIKNTSEPEANEDNWAEMEKSSRLPKLSSLNAKPSGIYLAYVPHDQVWLLKDDIDMYLVNYTNFEVLYTLTVKQDNQYMNIDYGNMLPQTKMLISTIKRDDLENFLQGYVQIMFFREQDKNIYQPVCQKFNVKPVRFFKENSFMACNFIAERALLVQIAVPTVLESNILSEKDDNLQEHAVVQKQIVAPPAFIEEFQTKEREAEIDLHIEALVEEHSAWTREEILEKQKSVIVKAIESAIAEHYQRIIFIHGVGNFILKNELIAILKQYSNLHFFDASMQKYGRGATEVLIKKHE